MISKDLDPLVGMGLRWKKHGLQVVVPLLTRGAKNQSYAEDEVEDLRQWRDSYNVDEVRYDFDLDQWVWVQRATLLVTAPRVGQFHPEKGESVSLPHLWRRTLRATCEALVQQVRSAREQLLRRLSELRRHPR